MKKLLVLFSILLALIPSCSIENEPQATKLLINIDQTMAKGFSPMAMDTESYEIIIVNNDKGYAYYPLKVSKDDRTVVQEVLAGNSTVIVNALNYQDQVVGSGQATVNVKSGQTNTANVRITEEIGEGLISFSIKGTADKHLNVNLYSGTEFSANTKASYFGSMVWNAEKSSYEGSIFVNNGFYVITITGDDGKILAPTDTVRIIKGSHVDFVGDITTGKITMKNNPDHVAPGIVIEGDLAPATGKEAKYRAETRNIPNASYIWFLDQERIENSNSSEISITIPSIKENNGKEHTLFCIAVSGNTVRTASLKIKETYNTPHTTIRVLNYLDWNSPYAANEVSQIWDKFSAEHPEIVIEREDLFNESFHQKTESYIASDNVPDVVYMWPYGRSTSLITTGSVQDLRPWLERDGLLDMYTPTALAQGDIIAELPNGTTSSHLMIANLAVLEKYGLEIPKTLQDLIDMVPVLAKDNIQVIAMDNMDSWVMQSCLFSTIVGRYGGNDWFNKVDAGEWKFTDEWFVNALEVINTLYNEGVISRASLNSPYTQSRGDFVNGKAAFYIDGDWSTGGFITDPTTGNALIDPAKQATDYAFMVFPEVPGEIIHNTSSGVIGTGFGLSSKLKMGTPEAEAAWTLIKYLQGEHVQKYRLAAGQSFPSYKGIDVDAFSKENNLDPFVGMRYHFYSNIDQTTPVCDGVLAADVHNFINTGLREIGLGSKTPAQVAAEVQQAWDAWIASNWK